MRFGALEIGVLLVLAAILLLVIVRRRNANAVEAPARASLEEIFGDPGPNVGPNAIRWAYGVLYEAGVDADSDPPYATKILLDADRRLSSADAQRIVRALL